MTRGHPGAERDQHVPPPSGRTTPVPGLSAFDAVISNTCRQGRGDEGAIDEALARLRAAMVDTIGRWPQDKGATFFVTFTVDRDGRTELYQK